jgi:hypothetical protein
MHSYKRHNFLSSTENLWVAEVRWWKDWVEELGSRLCFVCILAVDVLRVVDFWASMAIIRLYNLIPALYSKHCMLYFPAWGLERVMKLICVVYITSVFFLGGRRGMCTPKHFVTLCETVKILEFALNQLPTYYGYLCDLSFMERMLAKHFWVSWVKLRMPINIF